MKKYLILTIAICLHLGVMAQKTNFSGTWSLDSLNTDFGNLPPEVYPMAKTMKVVQTQDSIEVARQYTPESQGKSTSALSGQPRNWVSEDKHNKMMATVKYLDNSLLFSWHFEDNDGSYIYDRTETWRLSTDKQQLLVERITTLPDRIDKVKGVFNLKK